MPIVSRKFLAFTAIAPFYAVAAPTLIAAPAKTNAKLISAATPTKSALSLAAWNYEFDGDQLEKTWSWTAELVPPVNGAAWEARVPFHYQNTLNYVLLQLNGGGKDIKVAFWRVINGKAAPWGEAPVTLVGANQKGQLTLQRSAWQARVLWNGRAILSAFGPQSGGEIGMATHGAKFSGERLQPTEPVSAQDDFMRADGPTEDGMPTDEALATPIVLGKPLAAVEKSPAKSGEWKVVRGTWKTSMMIDSRVRFDSSRNPNPFVYRAETKGNGAAIASIGKWFWNNYSVAVAFKPVLKSANAPLKASVAAYAQPNGQAVIGELDLRSGRATLRQGSQILAQSAAFACAPNQWHRLFLEPGPGAVRLLVDGIERARFSPRNFKTWQDQSLAQGEAQLRAELGGGNFIDFDDVNIAATAPVSDDFDSAATGRWEDWQGSWQTRSEKVRAKTTSGIGLSITGDLQNSGLVEAKFDRSRAGKSSGVVFAARDKQNYFLARQTAQSLDIVAVENGKEHLLAQTKLERIAGQAFGAHPLAVEWQNGAIKARLGFDGFASSKASALVDSIPAGRVGIWADGAADDVVTSFRILSATPSWGEPPIPARFQKDRLMRFWASNAGAWRRVNPEPDFSNARYYVPPESQKKNPEQIWMHSGDFFRDAEVTVPIPDMAATARLTVYLQENFESVPLGVPVLNREKMRRVRPILQPTSASALPATDSTVQNLVPGGAYLQVERSGDSWQFKLFEGDKLIKTAGAPYAKPENKNTDYNPAAMLRFARRPLGDKQVALNVTLNGKMLMDETAPESVAGTKIIVRLTNLEGVNEVPEQVQSNVFWFDKAQADTAARLDYTFTGAPVDWFASRGRWEVAERWTCQPQWGFFRGYDDIDPTLWSRFAAQGDFTLEAYLATPMDLTRSEQSPTDINVTVGADGRDLSSGYSFIFAPKHRAPHYILRGDQLGAKTAEVMPTLNGDQHQDWYYVRIERRKTPQGLRFRWSVNNQEIADYIDNKPLSENAGRIAFWSHNFNLSIARVRLWHDGLESTSEEGNESAKATPIKNGLDAWTPRRDGLQEATARIETVAGQAETLKIINPQSGGDWTVYVSRKPVDVSKNPALKFSYRVPQGVFVNIYVKTGGRWREIGFTGDGTWGGLSVKEVPIDDSLRLGEIENVRADNQWHDATFDLKKALQNAGIDLQIDALAFAAPERGYLRAGIGGNHHGATYWLRDFQTLPAINTTVAALK